VLQVCELLSTHGAESSVNMGRQIHLIMLTYNRLDYTKLALRRLLSDPKEEFALTIWDNASTDGTQQFLKTVNDPRIVDIIFSQTNKGQTYVTNKIWSESSAELVGKVDNDCFVTPGWTSWGAGNFFLKILIIIVPNAKYRPSENNRSSGIRG